MTAPKPDLADKRGEMADAWVNRAATPEQLKPGYRLEYEAFIAGFDAGAEQMRERCAAYLDDYRKAYDEELCPSSANIEDIDPDDRTRTSFRMGRFVLDNARRDVRALPLDPKEAQDAE